MSPISIAAPVASELSGEGEATEPPLRQPQEQPSQQARPQVDASDALTNVPETRTTSLTLDRDVSTLHPPAGVGSKASSLSIAAVASASTLRAPASLVDGLADPASIISPPFAMHPLDSSSSSAMSNSSNATSVSAITSPATSPGHSPATPTPLQSNKHGEQSDYVSTPTPQPKAVAPKTGPSTHEVPRPVLVERKSVFGKLFDRTASSASSAATTARSSSTGGPTSSERMERETSSGGSTGTISTAETTSTGLLGLGRKPSGKKEKEKSVAPFLSVAKPAPSSTNAHASQQTGLMVPVTDAKTNATSPTMTSAASDAKSESNASQSLNDFMRAKIQRKPSASNKSEGKSETGGARTEKMSKMTDRKSTAGQANGHCALLKKYGVCEKVAIGKGATAVVKLAHKWDMATENIYAVKEFRKRRKNETEKEYVKKLTSEFCISSTLHHTNVVETVDLVQDEQNHWCEVMEYCPGGDLYAAIKKGNMSSQEINSYFKQMLSGVAYLHSMGVAHRDIKPENLLLDARGHVKITDFGVSDVFRMCWEKTTHLSKGLCGSEPYIAPEQFEHKEYDARLVDVWACAVVFYCMLFQELPWRVAKLSDPTYGAYAHTYSPNGSAPSPISNITPRECRSLVKKMLNPDPKTRIASADAILADPWLASIDTNISTAP